MRSARQREDLERELAVETLAGSGYVRFRATGTSMFPEIQAGDVLTVRRCGIDEPTTGDVVLFTGYGGWVVHRVVERGTRAELITRGDTVPQPDAPVTEERLLGIVEAVERAGVRFAPRRRPSGFSRLLAALARTSPFLNHAIRIAHARI